MCSNPRLDPNTLDLDTLAMLARHPRATANVQAAFSKALVTWSRQRIQMVTRRMGTFSTGDRDDLLQEFMLRCLTRHLQRWDPAATTLSAFLFRRLHGDVVDQLRRRITHEKRVDGSAFDPDTIIDEERGIDEIAARRHRERALTAVDAAVVRLPRRQRAVVRRTFAGESAADVAADLRVHPSTISRERSAALSTLRLALAA